jgi:TonB-linked SusC/RagA family outer membrane protein
VHEDRRRAAAVAGALISSTEASLARCRLRASSQAGRKPEGDFRMMPRTWTLACAALLACVGSAAAQAPRVALDRQTTAESLSLLDRPARLDVREASLVTALTRLSEASGVPVAFSPSLVGADRRVVNCDCRRATVRQALDRLLASTAFGFSELRGEVLVFRDDASTLRPGLFGDHRPSYRLASTADVLPIASLSAWSRPPLAGTVRGTVIDVLTRRPLAGVQISVQDTGLGAVTGEDGTFQIGGVPAGERVLRLVLIGYRAEDRSVRVANDEVVTITIELTQTALQLEGLVVTALGIERQERSLTTSVQRIGGNSIAQVPDPNLVAALSGKVSGVNIFNSNTPGGSSRIVIRGASSLTGGNQPLFVIDGVPVSNSAGSGVFGSRGYAAIDYGNAIQDINPNDVESISVLKGPNAAALYGSRAANGAIIITTKSGRGARGFGLTVTATNSLTFESPLKLPEYQNLYGQGNLGQFSYLDGKGGGRYDDYDESWGPRLDMGLMIPQFHSNGEAVPWTSSPNNVRNFFETGVTRNSAVSFTAANDDAAVRLSIGNFDQNGTLPGLSLRRTTVGLNASGGLTERLRAQGTVQYFKSDGDNRPAQGYSSDNVMFGYLWFGRQVDTGLLKNRLYNPDGSQYNWNNIWNNNPYWTTTVNRNWDSRHRVVGSAMLTYELTPWLTMMGRSGTDFYEDHRKRVFAAGTVGQSGVDRNGAFGEGTVFRQETNTDFLFSASAGQIGEFSMSANVGGNRRDGTYRSQDVYVRDLVIPGLYDLGNAAVTPDMSDWRERTRTNSLYAAGQVGWRDLLFVDVTGRNDWSSTLPEGNNSYFYPSVSTGLIVSDLFELPSVSYGKLRAGWTRVGSDASAFQLVDPYIASTPFDGVPRFSPSSRLRNFDLKPERTEAWEVGGEMRMLDDRLGFDMTYYHKRTSNQIVPAQISALTGFTSRMVNAGTIRNSGIELLTSVTPVRLANGLEWELTATYSKNNSMVEELYGDLETIILGEYYGVQVQAKKGEPYGQMYGRLYVRDGQGNIVVGTNGLPLNTASNPNGLLGNYHPDWTGGFGSRLSYGRVIVSGLLDVQRGGSIYSLTNLYGYRSGVLIETVQGREQADSLGRPITPANGGGLVVDGVRVVAGDTVPNDVRVTAQAYWRGLAGLREPFVFDASFVKLRELRVGIDLPRSLTDRMGMAQASVALIGRNLFLWSDVPHIDPETALDAGNAQGYEYGQLPSSRSIGFTITVTPRAGGRRAAAGGDN